MKAVPQIQKYMTTTPHTIGSDQTIATAKTMMREHGFRHLPVLTGGKLTGVLTDRDIKLIESLAGAGAGTLQVADAMTESVYCTVPDRELDAVAAEMAEHKYGSAVVVQNDKVVGIFTTTDACRALADLFATRLKK
jgi:acetoin utilization protein AcuB